MNLDRYEKIDGWQALERFKEGKAAFCFYADEFSEFVMVGGELYSSPITNHAQQRTSRLMTINHILQREWYIPKPFDVRQAMLDRPNEWVGAYKSGMGFWFKIGFDTDSMNAVYEELESDGLPFWQHNRVRPSMLKASIPIEDVPEEATQ